jgi:hypothetical protein
MYELPTVFNLEFNEVLNLNIQLESRSLIDRIDPNLKFELYIISM